MADSTVSALTAASTLGGTELVYVVQGGADRKTTAQEIADLAAGGTGTPGGSDTQVQYNDGGAFGGDAGFTYNETTNTFTLTGTAKVNAIALGSNELGITQSSFTVTVANHLSVGQLFAAGGVVNGGFGALFYSGATDRVSLACQGFTGQTADLFQLTDVNGVAKFTVGINGNTLTKSYMDITEISAPSAPAANTARLYAEDNGSGKTRLMVLFPSGAAQQLAIEP